MERIISRIKARQIFDSRGVPTIETEVLLTNGIKACAAVPSGASTGKFEAYELRDGDDNNYFGKGVLQAVRNVNDIISHELSGKDVTKQLKIDDLMIALDGSENKSNLGANAILSVSLACARAAANSFNIPLYKYLGGINATYLPCPMMNILNGGAHADNKLTFQEFMIVPLGAKTFFEAMKFGVEIFHSLKLLLKSKGLNTSVGDEGGFAPDLASDVQAIELLMKAIEDTSLTTDKVSIAIDAAASEFYSDGQYFFEYENKALDTRQMVSHWENIVNNYPVVSIEDALDEEDYSGWKTLTEVLGDKCQLVGDDLFTTNPQRLKKGIEEGWANSILIKPNQIGTLSETIDTVNIAQDAGYTTVMSHRSGETEDTFIADLAVALNCGQIKTGSLSRSERMCKYNRLLKIEEELCTEAEYKNPFSL
ncbi:MAG: phosphopyruvate hydratase [Candidatus Gastranaerophilales bacterium]|nr:phosphopyruvate hydratase [Candidatus Gastranaerophilales bacterium]